jgi:hypothetical protein
VLGLIDFKFVNVFNSYVFFFLLGGGALSLWLVVELYLLFILNNTWRPTCNKLYI